MWKTTTNYEIPRHILAMWLVLGDGYATWTWNSLLPADRNLPITNVNKN